MLDPTAAAGGDAPAPTSDTHAIGLPALRVVDLEMNVGNVRMSWPWKQKRLRYFEGCEWHPDVG